MKIAKVKGMVRRVGLSHRTFILWKNFCIRLCILCVERIFRRTDTFLENNMVTPDSTLMLFATFTTEFIHRTS